MRDERVALRQRRDLSQIIEAAATLYLQNLAPFFTIAAVVVPLGIAGAIFQTAIENDIAALTVVGIVNLGQVAVSLLAGAAIIAAIADIDGGRQPDFSRAYDAAFARFWTLLGAILRVVAVVVVLAITIIGFPWAIRQAIRWLFVEQAVMLEGKRAGDALDHSSETVIGSWWRTLGIALLIGIITGVPGGIVAALFSLAPPLVSGTVGAVVSAALLPFSAIAVTLLYFDLRARKAEPTEATS
jgi:hypothetical protein